MGLGIYLLMRIGSISGMWLPRYGVGYLVTYEGGVDIGDMTAKVWCWVSVYLRGWS